MGKKKQAAVAAIVFLSGRVLLIERRDIPVWVLPGGGIESDETPEQAALRELEEETGLRGAVVRKVAEYTPHGIMESMFSRTTHLFECTIVGGAPATSHETRRLDFFPLEKLPKLLPPPYPNWIQDGLARSQEVLYKRVEGISASILLRALLTHPLLLARFLLTKIGIHCNYGS